MVWDMHDLFRRHAHRIAASLRRSGLGADLAEDLTQDAFVRLMNPAVQASIDADRDPAAYLFRVSRNLLIDHRRRERRSPLVMADEADMQGVADPSPLAEARLYDRQRLLRTARALEELPERTRRAFEMHRLDGKTIAQVAAALDLSPTRVWTLIHDAYRHIRHRLNDERGD